MMCAILDKYQIPYVSGIAGTGVVATVGTKDEKVLLVRADIDALPINEKTDLPFASQNDGIMHACGHDAHTAIAMATLRRVWEMRDEIACCVKFVFQPAEEYITPGCKMMVENGVMDDIRYKFLQLPVKHNEEGEKK